MPSTIDWVERQKFSQAIIICPRRPRPSPLSALKSTISTPLILSHSKETLTATNPTAPKRCRAPLRPQLVTRDSSAGFETAFHAHESRVTLPKPLYHSRTHPFIAARLRAASSHGGLPGLSGQHHGPCEHRSRQVWALQCSPFAALDAMLTYPGPQVLGKARRQAQSPYE